MTRFLASTSMSLIPLHRGPNTSGPFSKPTFSLYFQNFFKTRWRLVFPVLLFGILCYLLLFANTRSFDFQFVEEWSPHRPPPSFDDKYAPPKRPYPPPPPPFKRPGSPGSMPPPSGQDGNWTERAGMVKDAFRFAWKEYREHAFPWDEVKPLTHGKVNNFNGWGVTIYDALDTMWIMELKDEWNDAVAEVANATFSQSSSEYAPFFETVIRYLGGVLSAYSLSGDSRLLRPAEDLGSGLLKALNTSTGLPMFAVQLKTGFTRQGWISDVLYSEAMSCQLEYKFLAHVTGKEEFYHPVEHIMQVIEDSNTPDSAYPTRWSHVTGQPTNQEFSVGAFADSGHEYLLKQYLMSSKSEPRALRMYLKSMNAIIDKLLYVTPNRGLLYVTDTLGVLASHKFEHLSCFLPGLLALGAVTLDLSPKDLERHTWAARGLAYTCYITYADQATGLGPDEVTMTPFAPNREEGLWVKQLALWEKAGRRGQVPGLNEGLPVKESGKRDYNIRTDGWFLRPEAIEAMFYMWKTTGEVVWRERGWEMFLAIEKFAKTDHGYASLRSVDILSPALKDESPSYFYAETLKYLYLMFREDDLIPLDQFVFNTEAHPLHVFEWTKREKEAYKLD